MKDEREMKKYERINTRKKNKDKKKKVKMFPMK